MPRAKKGRAEEAEKKRPLLPEDISPASYSPVHSGIWDSNAKDVARLFERLKADMRIDVADILNNGIFANRDRVKIVVNSAGIQEWRFVFGRDKGGQAGTGGGTGSGGTGDAGGSGGGGGEGDGSGGSSAGGGQGGTGEPVVIELSEEAFDEVLFQGLELPNLQPKQGGDTEVVGYVLSGLGPSGARPELDKRETFKRRHRRAVALGRRQQRVRGGPLIVPGIKQVPIAKRDQRFWQFSEEREPITEAVLFAVADRSASMDKAFLELMFSYFFLKFRFLRKIYKNVHVVMIAHGTVPVVCETEEDFRSVTVDSGTKFTPTVKKVLEIAKERFPANRFNLYWDEGSDGDMWDTSEEFRKAVMQLFDEGGFSFVTYNEVKKGAKEAERWAKGGEALLALPPQYLSRVSLHRFYDHKTMVEAFISGLTKNAASFSVVD